jgi:zinc and cadmium transporter
MIYALLATLVISLISLISVFALSLSEKKLKQLSFLLVSLAAGTLIGDVFIHLLPEIVRTGDEGLWIWVIGGIGLFFILEKVIHWRHCHIPTSENHPHPVGAMNLIGDGLHNFFDGALIAGSFLVDVHLGIATTIAVILHEIPQEIGDFGILIHAGYSKAKALSWNFFSALTAFLGVIIVFVIGQQAADSFGLFVVPITAGGFIYIAVSDLLPEMRKETRWQHSLLQLLLLAVGVAIMYGLKVYFG